MKKQLLFLILLAAQGLRAQQYFHDTQGALEVSASGNAIYTVPIALPPSAGEVGPVINLVYTSGMRGGIAGDGWSLQSISAISRIATRRDLDGNTDGVDFDANDQFALDGQRLLLTTGVHGADGAVYETETQSNTRIELHGSGANTYFVVTAPDGSRSWYGSYEGVQAVDAGSYFIVRFEDPRGNYLSYRYTRPFSKGLCLNYIDFSANTHSGGAPLNRLQFYYKAAQRREFAYQGGLRHEKAVLLDRIEVTTQGQLFRRYQLTHSADLETGYERLMSVQEYNSDNQPANPLLFEYDTTQTQVEGSEYPTTYDNNLDFQDIRLSGDFDGDTRLDFVTNTELYTRLFQGSQGTPPVALPVPLNSWAFPATTLTNNRLNTFQSIVHPTASGYTLSLNVYNQTAPNAVSLAYTKNLTLVNTTTEFSDQEVCVSGGEHSYASLPEAFLEGDFNGDGISEAIFVTPSNETIHFQQEIFVTYDLDGIPYETWECVETLRQNEGYDLFLVDLHPAASTVLGTPGYIQLEHAEVFDFGVYSKKYVLDFNGDGKTDVLSIKPDKTYKVIGFRQSPSPPYLSVELLGSGTLPDYATDKQLLTGDFNGDGKTDVLLPQAEGSTRWTIYYANPPAGGAAGGFFETADYEITEYWPSTEDTYKTQIHFRNYYALDLNGDGKTDLVEVWRRYYKPDFTINDHNTEWRVTGYANNIGYTAGGDNFTEVYSSPCQTGPAAWMNDCEHNSDSPDLPIPIAATYKHHGLNKELLLVRNHHNELTYIDFTKDVAKDQLLKRVTASGGRRTDVVTYQSLETSQPGSVYSATDAATYPLVEIRRSPGQFVVAYLGNTVSGVLLRQDFRYQDLLVNMDGKGPLGFAKTARSAWYADAAAPLLWTVQENDPALRGAPLRSYTQLVAGGGFGFSAAATPPGAVSLHTRQYSASTALNGRYSLLLEEETQQELLTGVSATTRYEYEPQYYLPVAVTTETSAGGQVQQIQTVSTQYSSDPAGGTGGAGGGTPGGGIGGSIGGSATAPYIGRPKEAYTAVTAYGDVFTTRESYEYDDRGNLTQREKRGHNTEPVTETYTYDTFGNPLSHTLSAPGEAPRTVHYQYDPTGRFVTTTTQPNGLQTQTTHHPLYGLPVTVTDPFGLTTSYEYDGWGKKTHQTDYLGNTTQWNYTQADGQYTVQETRPDGGAGLSVSDALGRVLRTGAKNLQGQWVYTETRYDALGRKTQQSEPFTDTPSQWSTISYDSYSRPVQTVAPTGRTSTMNYNGLTTTVNDVSAVAGGVKTTVTTNNAMGKAVLHTDPGGTIAYTYFPNGNLKTADYQGVVISIEQDGWGRKTRLSDPSAGTYTYTYNGYGELVQETTPNGTTSYTLDETGRLLQKTLTGEHTEQVADYSYDPVSQQLTEINGTSQGESYSYAYSYDAYQRLSETVERTPWAQFSKTLSYDALGRVATETQAASLKDGSKSAAVTLGYDYENGFLRALRDTVTGLVLWEAKGENARGQLTQGTYGNGITVTNSYDEYGYPVQYRHALDGGFGAGSTAAIMTLDFAFEPQRGLLQSRSYAFGGQAAPGGEENFGYDELDRLTQSGGQVQEYDARGRIMQNPGVGAYAYAGAQPYQATQVTLTPEAHTYYQQRGAQKISYNAFKSPVNIWQEGSERMDFSYNLFQSRSARFYGSEDEDRLARPLRKFYAADGGIEISENIQTGSLAFVFYLGGDAYSAPAVYTSDGAAGEFLYLHRDYLGSILAITNQNAEIVEKRHFDAWGNLTNVQDGQGNTLDKLTVLDRGYTGHEHLQSVGLIHMNGRLYDPLLHRFLAPDNYVQDPYNTQNFNRYGYVLNNPLLYTDPNGEWLVPILIGAAVAAATYTITALTADVPFTVGGIIKATVIGAFSAAVTYGIGEATAVIPQLGTRIAVEAVAHGLFQGAMAGVQGGNFWQGAASGALASVAASLYGGGKMAGGDGYWDGLGGKFSATGAGQIAFGTISGGAGAALTGGNFWQGAATGFVVSALNHAFHNKKPDPIKLKRQIEKDGRLTFREANQWYRDGDGSAITVDASKVDLDFINPDNWTVGQEKSVQLLFSSRDGRTYGNLTLIYKGNNQFEINPDTYNFEMHKGSSAKTWVRNQATKLGSFIAGKGVEYDINFYGINTVIHRVYTPQFPTGPKY